MDKNNCNINLNQFEEQEIIPILTEVINVANKKIASLKEELKTKIESYEKEKKDSSLLSSEALDAARKDAEKDKSDALDAARKEAEKDKSDALDAARKEAEKDKTDALDAARKEAEAFRNNLKKRSISIFLEELSQLISVIHPVNESWRKYISDIKKDFDELISSEKGTDDIVTELFKPNSGLTHLASMVWWYNQVELCDNILKVGEKVDDLINLTKVFFKLLNIYNECVVLPPNGFNHTAELYDSFSYKTSGIRELFPTIRIDNQVLCEIYQLARNNAKGKCYLS